MEHRHRLAIATALIGLAVLGHPPPARAQESPWSRLAICDAAFTSHRYRTAPIQPGENVNEPACAAQRDSCLAAAGSDITRRNQCTVTYNLCVINGLGSNNRLQSPYGYGVISECYVNSYVDPGNLSATFCDKARALRDQGLLEYQACQGLADPDAQSACADAAISKAFYASGVMSCE